MANLIQIKRSLNTAQPVSLANGELAFTSNGDVLYIGANGAIAAIGGKRNPGTLTANQALVANSSSGIDKVIVANLVATAIYANNTFGTANQVLRTTGSGVYWADDVGDISSIVAGTGLTGGGSSGDVTLNVGSGNGIAVDADSIRVVANSGLVSNATGVFINVSGDSTLIANATGLYVNDASLSIATSQLTGDVALGTQTSGNYVATITAGAGISGSSTGEGGTPTIAVVANSGLLSNATGVYVVANNGIISNTSGVFAKAANGTSVDASGINVVGAAGLVSNTTGVHVGQGNGIAVDADSIRVVGSNSIVSNTTGVFVNPGSTLTVNTTGVHVNNTLSITSLTTSGDTTVNGNTILGNAATDVVTFNADVNSNIIPSANITYNLGTSTDRWNYVYAANVHSSRGYFEGNVEIIGDLIVSGNVTTQNVSSLEVQDPLIYLAGGNYASDLVDIGFVGNYFDGATQRHAGLVRHAADDQFHLFKNYTAEPDNNIIDIGNTTLQYTQATLNAFLNTGKGFVANSTAVALTANSTVSVNITANGITLATPLAATSGGTGQNTYSVGDLLVGAAGNTLAKLTLGTDGKILQSNGSAVVYSDLDGGTF